jgi:hydrogenase maturation protease
VLRPSPPLLLCNRRLRYLRGNGIIGCDIPRPLCYYVNFSHLLCRHGLNMRALIIGYGNTYCHDDGVALVVINELRRLYGLRELQPDEDGLDDLGHEIDSIMLHQLVPEVVPVVANYPCVIFVDAHVGSIPDDVRVIRVQEEYRFHAVTHHMSPGMLLSMARETTGHTSSGYLVSVRGENFDFGLGLSDPCRRRVDGAIRNILDLFKETV